MKALVLAEAVAATGTVTQTAVAGAATPFLSGRDVILRITSNGMTGTPTIIVETSPDNTTWTTVATHTALNDKEYNVKVGRYNRARQSVAGSAGTYSAYMENGA